MSYHLFIKGTNQIEDGGKMYQNRQGIKKNITKDGCLTLSPTESTRLMTVWGKQEPMCATTQSKWGAWRTLVSSSAAIQLSVSVSASQK